MKEPFTVTCVFRNTYVLPLTQTPPIQQIDPPNSLKEPRGSLKEPPQSLKEPPQQVLKEHLVLSNPPNRFLTFTPAVDRHRNFRDA